VVVFFTEAARSCSAGTGKVEKRHNASKMMGRASATGSRLPPVTCMGCHQEQQAQDLCRLSMLSATLRSSRVMLSHIKPVANTIHGAF
jgi:hypothetical protein